MKIANMDTLTGTCHCGTIKFKLSKKPKLIINCHCDACKKRNGSAFSTYLAIAEQKFHLTEGEEILGAYEAENDGIKYFCRNCGSPLFNKNYRLPGLYLVFYGACTEPQHFTPSYNVFCESKHDWVDNIDTLKSFATTIKK